MTSATLKYSLATLKVLKGRGHAYQLPGGEIIPTAELSDIGSAVIRARDAYMTGAPDDNPGLRAHLRQRARASGVGSVIPANWDAAGKSSPTELVAFEPARIDAVAKPATGIPFLLRKSLQGARAAKAAGRPVSVTPSEDRLVLEFRDEAGSPKVISFEGTRTEISQLRKGLADALSQPGPGERAELLAKAVRYEREAGLTADMSTSDGYRQLARQAREEAGGAAGHLVKAAEYEREAGRAIVPSERAAYEQLARQAREKAGAAA